MLARAALERLKQADGTQLSEKLTALKQNLTGALKQKEEKGVLSQDERRDLFFIEYEITKRKSHEKPVIDLITTTLKEMFDRIDEQKIAQDKLRNEFSQPVSPRVAKDELLIQCLSHLLQEYPVIDPDHLVLLVKHYDPLGSSTLWKTIVTHCTIPDTLRLLLGRLPSGPSDGGSFLDEKHSEAMLWALSANNEPIVGYLLEQLKWSPSTALRLAVGKPLVEHLSKHLQQNQEDKKADSKADFTDRYVDMIKQLAAQKEADVSQIQQTTGAGLLHILLDTLSQAIGTWPPTSKQATEMVIPIFNVLREKAPGLLLQVDTQGYTPLMRALELRLDVDLLKVLILAGSSFYPMFPSEESPTLQNGSTASVLQTVGDKKREASPKPARSMKEWINSLAGGGVAQIDKILSNNVLTLSLLLVLSKGRGAEGLKEDDYKTISTFLKRNLEHVAKQWSRSEQANLLKLMPHGVVYLISKLWTKEEIDNSPNLASFLPVVVRRITELEKEDNSVSSHMNCLSTLLRDYAKETSVQSPGYKKYLEALKDLEIHAVLEPELLVRAFVGIILQYTRSSAPYSPYCLNEMIKKLLIQYRSFLNCEKDLSGIDASHLSFMFSVALSAGDQKTISAIFKMFEFHPDMDAAVMRVVNSEKLKTDSNNSEQYRNGIRHLLSVICVPQTRSESLNEDLIKEELENRSRLLDLQKLPEHQVTVDKFLEQTGEKERRELLKVFSSSSVSDQKRESPSSPLISIWKCVTNPLQVKKESPLTAVKAVVVLAMMDAFSSGNASEVYCFAFTGCVLLALDKSQRAREIVLHFYDLLGIKETNAIKSLFEKVVRGGEDYSKNMGEYVTALVKSFRCVQPRVICSFPVHVKNFQMFLKDDPKWKETVRITANLRKTLSDDIEKYRKNVEDAFIAKKREHEKTKKAELAAGSSVSLAARP